MLAEFKEVKITPTAYEKIMFFVNECDKEIGGMGKVVVKDGAYWITDAYLLEQEVTAATTDLDAESLGKLMAETIREEGHLNFWWHSHVNMRAFWSGTDTDTIRDIGKAGFCLATVFNKKGDTRTAYYQGGDDFLPAIWVDDITLKVASSSTKVQEMAWKAEMDEKVRLPKPIVYQDSQAWRTNPHGGTTGTPAGSTTKTTTCSHWDSISGLWMSKNQLKKVTKRRNQAAADLIKREKLLANTNTGKESDKKPWIDLQWQERQEWADVYEQWHNEENISLWGVEIAQFYREWGHLDVKFLLGETA